MKMKKFTAIMMAACMVVSLAACSSGTPTESAGAPTAEAPASTGSAVTTEAPASTESPVTEEPAESTPETSAPEINQPDSVEAETTEPETDAPETTTPATTTPATTTPATTTPATTKPETTKPETTKPTTTKPETTKPATTVTQTTAEPEEPVVIEKDEISDPTTLLKTAWALFGEDEKFPVTGGDFSSGELIEEAAPFSLADPDSLDYVTGFPAAEIGKIDSAATLMHMMNQNTFTAGAFHVVEGMDMKALSSAVRDNIMNRMWCCGFPDKMIVVNVGEYLVCAFGKNQPIDSFSAHLVEAYPTAVIVVDEPIL